jgi:hypothetical protein
MSSVTRKCTEAALTANARVFAAIGSIIGHPIGAAIVGTISLAVLAFLVGGIGDVKYENELEKLWIEEGSRAEDENKVIEDAFGGASRLGLVTMHFRDGDDTPSSSSDGGMLDKESLYAFGNLTKPLLTDDGQIFINETFDGTEYQFAINDFCERPDVPAFVQPFTATGVNYRNVASIASWAGPQKVGSGGLYYVSHCFSDLAAAFLMSSNSTTVTEANYIQLQFWFETYGTAMNTLLDSDAATKGAAIAARPGLPDGWGFDRFPCTRAHPLDCWSDGGFNSPLGLTQLEEYSMSMMGLFDGTSTLENSLTACCGFTATDKWINICLGGNLPADMSQPPVSASAADIATTVDTIVSAAIFLGAGYWWRPSLEEQANDVAGSFIESLNNTAQFTTTDCVGEGFIRKTAGVTYKAFGLYPLTGATPLSAATAISGGCCTAWEGSALTSLLFVGGLIPKDFRAIPANDNRFAFALRSSSSFMSDKNQFLNKRLKADHGITTLSLDDQKDLLNAWDQAWIDYLEPRHKQEAGTGFGKGEEFAEYKPDFLVDRAIGDLLKDAADVETSLLIAGYVTLVAFSMFNFVVWTCPPTKDGFVYSSSGICFVGVCVVGLSVAAGFGFMAWLEVKLSPVNAMLVPFLAMGLGLDDVFVMLTDYSRHRESQDEPQRRMVDTMADAGSSITVTSMANMVAFLMPAAVIRLPAVYTFGYQMGASVILNWFSLMFLFGPLLFLDAMRMKKRCSCGFVTAEDSESATITKTEGRSLHRFIEVYLAPLYTKVPFKIFSMVAFLALTAVLGWYGFDESTEGLKLSDVTTKGSYVRSFTLLLEDYFPILPGDLLSREISYEVDGNTIDISQFQGHIKKFLVDSEKSSFIDPINSPSSLHWLPSLQDFFTGTAGGTLDSGGNIPAVAFYPTMRSWLATSGATSLSNLICRVEATGELDSCGAVDGTTIKIIATKSSSYYVGIDTDADYIEAIEDIREKADASDGIRERCCEPFVNASAPFTGATSAGDKIDPVPLFYSGSLFRYWQQYVGIQDTMLKGVGFSLLGVFGATLLFSFNVVSSLLVGIMLVALVLQLYGFMAIMGIKLNGFSILNLAVAVGMGVEMTAHISYAYLRHAADTENKSRQEAADERMKLSLVEMFPPMLAGSVTTFISVICLAFAKYPFFALYYFQMIAMMIVLAFINGMWFLPIILSLVNPTGIDKKHAEVARTGSFESPSGGAEDRKLEDDGL